MIKGSCECFLIRWLSTKKIMKFGDVTICPDCKTAVIWNLFD